MNAYPRLEIDTGVIRKNARIILELCRKNRIEPFAVIKGFNGIDEIVEVLVEEGFGTICSSRIPHLAAVKEKHPGVQTLSLRIPMQTEVSDIIRYCDISLNSEVSTLRLLDREAALLGKVHKVVLMRDLGDLREGIFERERFIETAVFVEESFPNLHLYGIGANLTCYGSVIPSKKNLSVLAGDAEEIESVIGRKLEIVSGGGTTSIPLMFRGEIPKGINNLRIGEAIILPFDLTNLWNAPVPGLSNESMVLKAEIIEIGEKPTHPVGELGMDCFGSCRSYQDRGIRKRALLAMGAFDFGDHEKLVPRDEGVRILGASSDHMIVDIQESEMQYKLGDAVSFGLRYQAMLFATNNGHVKKSIQG